MKQLSLVKFFTINFLCDKYHSIPFYIIVNLRLNPIITIKANQRTMKHSIQILGTGCPKCQKLTNVVKDVVDQNQIDATIDKVEDIAEIMKFDVMMTPALVIDGNVVAKGRIPSKTELTTWLQN